MHYKGRYNREESKKVLSNDATGEGEALVKIRRTSMVKIKVEDDKRCNIVVIRNIFKTVVEIK